MARRNEQTERRKFLTQSRKNLGENFLFPPMSAAAEEHGAPWTYGRQTAGFVNIRAIIKAGGIVLNATSVFNRGARYAERCPSIDVIPFLHADQIQKPKRRRDKKSKPSKSPLGPWR